MIIIKLDDSWCGMKQFKKLYYLICIKYNITEREISFEQFATFIISQSVDEEIVNWHNYELASITSTKEEVLRVILEANETLNELN